MAEPIYKYEFSSEIVKYLSRAVNTQQIRGEREAQDLIAVLGLMREPVNKAELEKESLETLKEKYEPSEKKKK